MSQARLFFMLCIGGMALFGQTASRNLSDGLTPPAVAPGAPDGVKALSSLESINLYNGQLSVSIPLLRIGGRGEAGYEIVARVGSAPWTITTDTVPYCPVAGEPCTGFIHTSSASNRELYPYESPYSPGLVFGKRSGHGPYVCGSSGETVYSSNFTHIVFEKPDGGQVKLWDGGGPSGSGLCSATVANRGKRFSAIGESQILFLSNTDIWDNASAQTPDKFLVSGELLFPTGTRYKVENGVVTRITDRNGNFVTIRYIGSTNNPYEVEDSLGMIIQIHHDVQDPTYGRVDRILYTGAAGQGRTIYVERTWSAAAMPIRPGLTTPSPLFQNAGPGFNNFDRLLKKIRMADGRTYEFQYTPYGELARMVLPTGGAVEYDHGAGLANAGGTGTGMFVDGGILDAPGTITSTSDPNVPYQPAIYRRVLTRRTYPDGGTQAESTTTYSRRETGGSPIVAGGKVTGLTISGAAYVEESTTGTGIGGSIVMRHWFFENSEAPLPSWSTRYAALPGQSMLFSAGAPRMPSDDNVYEGVEYRTGQPGLQSATKGFLLAADVSRALRVCQESVLAGDSTNKRGETLLYYDSRGNLRETYSYGFNAGPTVQSSSNGVPQSCAALPGGSDYLKRTLTGYQNGAAYLADNRYLLALPVSEEVFGPGGAQVSKTIFEYDQRAALPAEESPIPGHDGVARTERGNITAVIRYKNGSAGLTTAYQYDVLGNARYMLPPNLVAAQGGSYSGTASLDNPSTNAGKWTYVSGCGSAFSTGETLPGAAGPSVRFSTSTVYDCSFGQPSSFTDINGVVTAFGYGNGPADLDRLISVRRAANLAEQAKTTYEYGITPGNLYVLSRSSVLTVDDGAAQKKSLFDGLGRETESQEWNGTAWITRKKVYDGAHRLWRAYNPAPAGPGGLYTETSYDGMGRPTLVVTPDGAKTTYAYSENAVTMTDPGNVAKQTATDALGRLESVTEAPGGAGVVTRYFYDANGNLRTVCPSGGTLSASTGACTGTAQARSFSYDWLGRIETVMNPESSTITYAYDETASVNGMGNLTSKTQWRGVATQATVTTRYHYDNLGRMTSKVYSGTPDGIVTPGVTYSYDTHNPAIGGVTSYAKGRRTRVEVAGGAVAAVDSFDGLGRPTRSRQVVGNDTQRFGSDGVAGYEYMRSGALRVMRLPTGRALTYSFDGVGRVIGVTDGATNYVTSVGYTDAGAIGTVRMSGNWIRERRTYDAARLQMTGVVMEKCADNTSGCGQPEALRTLGYTYTTAGAGNGGGPANNGNVRTQTITDPGAAGVTQIYGYDAFSRLTAFSEGALSETYCYDDHGNRAVVTRPGLPTMTPQVTSCTAGAVSMLFPGNRVSVTPYDAAGGIGYDGAVNVRYDAEDRVVKSWPNNGVETFFGYDGDGRRVTVGNRVMVYDAFGKLAVEYGGTVAASGREYVGVDHLGSTRAVMGETGAVVRRMDFWPFGAEMSGVDTAWRTAGLGFVVDGRVRMKFTGKERDSETGWDYFGARYMSSAQGRFTSPDPVWITPRRMLDPQELNLYAYVRNNPLKYIDPDGTILELAASSEEDARKKFALIQRGLTQTDRSHVRLVVGNGKNGFAKGHFGITADADHKSNSRNFQTLQGTANSKDLAIASIVGPGSKFASNVGVQKGTQVVIASFKEKFGQDNYVSSRDAVPGQTLFQLFGAPLADTLYSPDKASRIYVANDQADSELVKTLFHELRHIYLGDFGRSIPKGSHPAADKDIQGIERESDRNFSGTPVRKK